MALHKPDCVDYACKMWQSLYASVPLSKIPYVPASSPSRGGEVTIYVLGITNRACPLFYSVLVSVSVFKALSTVFHCINSPDNSPLSHSVLLVLFRLTGPFNPISLRKSLSALK